MGNIFSFRDKYTNAVIDFDGERLFALLSAHSHWSCCPPVSEADETNEEIKQHCEALGETLAAGQQQLAFLEAYEGGGDLLRQVRISVTNIVSVSAIGIGNEPKHERRPSETSLSEYSAEHRWHQIISCDRRQTRYTAHGFATQHSPMVDLQKTKSSPLFSP